MKPSVSVSMQEEGSALHRTGAPPAMLEVQEGLCAPHTASRASAVSASAGGCLLLSSAQKMQKLSMGTQMSTEGQGLA